MIYAIYFLAGLVMDAIITLYYRAIAGQAVLRASILAMVITFFTIFVINGIIERRENRRGKLFLIISYALGNGIGTALILLVGV